MQWVRRVEIIGYFVLFGHPIHFCVFHCQSKTYNVITSHIVQLWLLVKTVIFFCCRLKAYIVLTFWAKNQSFWNKSGKTQPIQTKFGIHGHVKGWQRTGNFRCNRSILAKMGAGTSPTESEFFFCLGNHATFRELCNGWFSPNLVTKRSLVSRQWILKDILKYFHFMGHLPPKSDIEMRSNTHPTQSRLQVTECTAERYFLLHVVVQGPGSFRGESNFLYDVRLRSYGVSKLPNFRI